MRESERILGQASAHATAAVEVGEWGLAGELLEVPNEMSLIEESAFIGGRGPGGIVAIL